MSKPNTRSMRIEAHDRLNNLRERKRQLKEAGASRDEIIRINKQIAAADSHLTEMDARQVTREAHT